MKDISHKNISHKYVCSLRIKNENGKKTFGDSMPCKMCCKRLKKHGIQKVIFCHNSNIVTSSIDEIEKYAVYTSGVHYSTKSIKNF